MPVSHSQSPVSLRKLPQRPDIDQLKRQAKELRHAYDAGDAKAIAEVRQYFHVAADEPLTLTHAQLVLARSYGFDSWPKLKAHIDGATFARLREAVKAGDVTQTRDLLKRRPELVNYTADDDGERRLIHFAVMNDDIAMTRELMRAGANARIGIWPHRESTSAFVMATERELARLVAAIEDEEEARRESMSCPNVTITPQLDQLHGAIREHRNDDAVAMLQDDASLMKQCDRHGGSALHVACASANVAMVNWLCDRHADANKPDMAGHTPMDVAVHALTWRAQSRRQPCLDILQRLQSRGSETTPLAAAALADVESLRRIHREAPKHLTANDHWLRGGLLTVAVKFGQIESVRCLLDLGLNPDEPIRLDQTEDDEWSWGGPLWHAASFGERDIATLLLDRGADPNANVYASGWPLDRAYERESRDMVDLLYARGAKASVYTVCNAHDEAAAARILQDEGDEPEVVCEMLWSAACSTSLPIARLALQRLKLQPDDPKWHDLLRQPMRHGEPAEAMRSPAYQYAWRFEILQLMLDAGANPNVPAAFGLTLLQFTAASGAPSIDDRTRFTTQLLRARADPTMRDELLESTALGWACRYGRLEMARLLLDRGSPANEPATPRWASPLAWATKMGHTDIVDLLRQHGASQ